MEESGRGELTTGACQSTSQRQMLGGQLTGKNLCVCIHMSPRGPPWDLEGPGGTGEAGSQSTKV